MLVGALATEGWLYSIIAGLLGAILGIGFGWLIAWRAGEILGSGREINALHLTFTFDASTVLTGFAIGLRDLGRDDRRVERPDRAVQRDPGDPRHPRRRRGSVPGADGRCSGSPVRARRRSPPWLGSRGREPYLLMVGPMLVAVGLGPMLARRFPQRTVTTAVCIVVLVVVGRAASAPLAALDATIEIPLFLLQGLAMAAAAVILVTTHLGGIGGALERGGGGARPPDSVSPTRWRAGSAPR